MQINNKAFAECENLTSVIIPSSVTTIAYDAFDGCSSLTTIYGTSGSYAQTFANNNSYTFIDLDSLLVGDINADGLVNGKDINSLAEIAVGITGCSAIQKYIGDFNSDGVIDGFDVALLDKYVYKDID